MLDRLCRNLDDVRARIDRARARGTHAADHVQLVAVTKSTTPALFPLLHEAGVRDVGENRIQAAAERRPLSPPGWTWHGIGHLQRNKAARAVELFDVFHALDSVRLAERLESVLASKDRLWDVYIQVNVVGDATRSGVRPEETLAFMKRLTGHAHLQPKGFMTMARFDASEAEARTTFRTLREVRDDVVASGVGLTQPRGLSMGMTDDFEWAVEEGATSVRVGRALFDGVGDGREAEDRS